MPLPQFTYISNEGIIVATGGGSSATTPESWTTVLSYKEEQPRLFVYSPDGNFLAWVFEKSIRIVNARTLETVNTIEVKSVIDCAFSPKGTYLSTWVRFVKTEGEGDGHRNLTIWNAATGEQLVAFSQKSQVGWNVNWTPSENLFARQVTNEIQFFNPAAPPSTVHTVCHRLKCENLKSFSLSTNKTTPGGTAKQSIAVFSGEKGGAPASVKVYDVANLGGDVLSQRTFFNADSVDYLWNADGTCVLIHTHTEVDKTNQSYYGKSSLHYLSTTAKFDTRVDLGDGPIHNVNWSPNSKEFIVVHGAMPSQATLFDHRCQPLYNFPCAPRNFVSYSPHGRFIAIAGFGNLAGDMDIYDRMNFTKLTTIHAPNSTSCVWLPDGRHILTTTLYKRLKVDNGLKFWHYRGPLVSRIDVKECLDVQVRYDDALLWPKKAGLSPVPQGLELSGAGAVPAKPTGVYRPPGARGREGGLSFLQRESPSVKAGPVVGGGRVGTVGSVPVGAAAPTSAIEDKVLSKAALKNQKKRAAAKKDSSSSPSTTSNPQQQQPPPPAAIPAFIPTDSASKLLDLEKKLKNLNKKMKQIQDIKDRRDRGEKLELTQLAKIEGEAAVAKEIGEMTDAIAKLSCQ